ncbi:hypothetical protein SCLCIDRAFT_20326 [Scleroderma citrinum Foug A]|uniref:Uncharacterized protein n=1 Tax=Scleroderma citrinum Foug A TaxID=1036808 RepID=A0A0C3ATX5_9AGAM|nr:hypothetical protein SCLCIDRAFT_20326 [Scleroderma citrinum Foug A]
MLPIYSFWRMVNFSWGATRVVLGESGKRFIIHDEGKFDPRSISLKTWNDYISKPTLHQTVLDSTSQWPNIPRYPQQGT